MALIAARHSATKTKPAERGASAVGTRVLAPATAFLRQYAPAPDPRGPRVLLGLAWFGVLGVATFLRWLLPLVLGVTAVLAALQVAGRLNETHRPAHQLLAAVSAGALVAAAAVSTVATGIVLIGVAVAALLLPPGRAPIPFDLQASGSAAWYTLRSGAFVGVALASVVLVQGLDEAALGFMVVGLCAYDAGDYLISAGEPRGRWLGPLAGMAATLLWTFGMAVFDPPPFSGNQPWAAGIALALGCPLGQWFASSLLPKSTSRAAALRRVDSWLLAAPAFLISVWLVS